MAIPKRILGSTGAEVTALGLGGVCWNLAEEDAQAVEVAHHAIDRGITTSMWPAATRTVSAGSASL